MTCQNNHLSGSGLRFIAGQRKTSYFCRKYSDMKMMKKVLLASVVMLLLSSTGVFAQYKAVELGVKVAPNFGWIRADADKYSSEGIVPGIAWGLMTDFYFAENYAFATGFSVVFQNGKMSYPDLQVYNIGVLDRKYRMKYVDIPLTIKMKTNDLNNFRFYGQFGFQPGVRIGSKARDSFKSDTPGIKVTKNWHSIESETKLFRVGMVVGIGLEYPIDNSTSLMGGITFLNGLTDILKGKNAVDGTVEHRGFPNAFELTLGILF